LLSDSPDKTFILELDEFVVLKGLPRYRLIEVP
jgi:hypothetical protein